MLNTVRPGRPVPRSLPSEEKRRPDVNLAVAAAVAREPGLVPSPDDGRERRIPSARPGQLLARLQ